MNLRDYVYLGTTDSLCPECLEVVPAKIIVKGQRVYFRKKCQQHGERDDFVCSDVRFFDQTEYSQPARLPNRFGVQPDRGCPYDCGLCTEHEQHTCIGLVELTQSCNLTCPMCYAASAPGGKHASLADCKAAIDRLVEVEGQPEVLQLSGGEPTIHPEFESIVEYALSCPIDFVQINTNGIRLASDPELVGWLAQHRERLEIFLQFDGFTDEIYQALRGEALLETKLRVIDRLGELNLNVTLAVTLQAGVNVDQMGEIVRFAAERRWITGINFQPATYSGRHVLPEELEDRVTFPDVIKGIATQTDQMVAEEDFLPLPCAHPNCHSLAHLWRADDGTLVPINRMIDLTNNLDLLANGIVFTRERAQKLATEYLSRQMCCGGAGGCGPEVIDIETDSSSSTGPRGSKSASAAEVQSFLSDVVAKEIGADRLLRITITSFLDVYNFDLRRLMKCCTHHVLPSGHVIPFCAYNVLYRSGHVELPKLADAVVRATE